MRTEVYKFGGTSVADGARLREAAALVAAAAEDARLVVVTSALAGVTDSLVAMAEAAARHDREAALAAVDALAEKHRAVLADLGGDAVVGEQLERMMVQLSELLRAVAWLGELTPSTRDRVLAAGEKLAVRLLGVACRGAGLDPVLRDADTFLETDNNFGQATPLHGLAERRIRRALDGPLMLVTGFCGQAPSGATTTLGRGGSDLTATLIAAALDADEVTIWTDVDGVHSADPRVVPESRRIDQLNYREATELSYYGARILHQSTIIAVAEKGIPVRIRSALDSAAPGTLVDGRFTPGSHPVKAISAIREQALISVEGKGMAGVPGVAGRLFAALAAQQISVTMISQSSSESSICFAVAQADAVAAELALKRAFRGDISHGDVEEIVVTGDVGLVAAVGLGMTHTPGVAARVFAALGRQRINVVAIAQGSSELNITLALDGPQVDQALRALHQEFGLHRRDTGEASPGAFDILLLGCGKIGRALAELVLERRAHLFERFGLQARIVALCDRSGYLFQPTGIPLADLSAALDSKQTGRSLAELPGATPSDDPVALVRHALSYRLARPVLVDVSDHEGAHSVFLEALRLGCDVVTANKKPLSGALSIYEEIVETARAQGRILKAEATVGAGLPVVDTLEILLGTGDRLHSAEGSFSGTLAYIMSELETGTPFSRAVAEAVRLGYAEPDPVADLSGSDVARKAVILGRFAGLIASDEPVQLSGLVDPALSGLPEQELFARLAEYDAPLAAQVAAAREAGQALRFLARVTPEGIEVGPVTVPLDSPAGGLRGTDNLILFRSDRYRERPLVITGPGAGIEVTAMGLLGDILRVAAERR